jgi:hypothetical protein
VKRVEHIHFLRVIVCVRTFTTLGSAIAILGIGRGASGNIRKKVRMR